VAVPDPPVRLEGLIIEVNPAEPEDESETVEEKWFTGVIVMIDEPVLPALATTFAGLAVIV
jgi:hypothetical protein